MISCEYEGKLVGKTVSIVIYDIAKEISDLLFKEAYREGIRLEKIFNFYDKTSELSFLNKKRKMTVSHDLLKVIKKALEYCEITKGEYDISIGKHILERKSGKELSKINCSYKDIKINGNEVSLENDDVLIDLGSIAKGYIVDKIAEFLESQGVISFFIDGRGDMKAVGKYEESIGIQHPRAEDKTICQTQIKNSSIATSGDYKQFYQTYEKSHIIGKKDLISVSVIADNLMEADVFASAVFLINKKLRENIIKKNPQFKVLTIDENLNKNAYNGFLL